MLNSAEITIYPPHKCKMPTIVIVIVGILTFTCRKMTGFCDLNLKLPLILAILVLVSSINFMLSRVQHEKSFRTSCLVFHKIGSLKIALFHLMFVHYTFSSVRVAE